jgi:hypothetical protein
MAGVVAPTLATSCAALPPGEALRLRPGKAGSAAPARVKKAAGAEIHLRLAWA